MATILTDGAAPSSVVTHTNGDIRGHEEEESASVQYDSRPRPPTTTISTIAVQSGNTRIVIALLQSKEWIQLKIQEMHPSMTDIGTCIEDAHQLNQQHEKVLEKLQTKQSPVEELLRQADELIATQKPRGEVYSAMAENLGLAWKDLNAQLEQRRQILEQAVAFFTKSRDFNDILDRIQKNLADAYLPDSSDLCATMIQRHQEERKVALSCSMQILKEGQLLLEKLCEVATHSMGDSRPLHMQHAARETSSFVERHMEALHDRWRHLEALWVQRKLKLEQCLKKCQFLAELNEIQTWLKSKGNEFAIQSNLGDSLATAEILQHEHSKAEKESKEKQDLTLKLVRTAEQLAHSGNYAGEEIKAKAYEVLSDCSELLNILESRSVLLSIAIVFFNSAQTALNKFDQIELQLTTRENIASQQANLNVAVEEVTSSAIEEGRNLIAKVGSHEPGVQGIVRKVEELERKRLFLLELWQASQAENSQRANTFRNFNNNYTLLLTWITNNGQSFLQRNRDMGNTHITAKSFVDQHELLQNDIQVKGIEVESLISTIPELVRIGGAEAQDALQKSENLREQFSQLRLLLDKRILIGHSYLSFHKLAIKVKKDISDLEIEIKGVCDGTSPSNVRNVEEKLLTLQQETLQLKNSGRNFLEDAQKIQESYLNMTTPCNTVRAILDDVDMRKNMLNTQWTNWQNQISSAKEIFVQWENLIKDSHRIVKNTKDVESKMFPVIPKELNKVESILPYLENRMVVLMPQIKTAQQELNNFLKKADELQSKDKPQIEGSNVVIELKKISQNFQKKLTDYQILISMMTAYFKNFIELEKMIDMQESQFKVPSLPNDPIKVETLIHDHNACKPTILELFKFTSNESDQVLKKINESEPVEAAIQDKEKISSVLLLRKKQFEVAWEEYKIKLEQHLQMCAFNRDMQQINQQIQELNTQLGAMKDNYGDSLPNAVVTSEAFVQFEKTIEILEIRIQNFISTAERLMTEKKVESNLVRKEIQIMQTKWSTFRTQVTRKRQLVEISIEYYKLVEECEEWLKEGSRVLMTIARQSSLCKTTTDANALNKEIQDFLNKGQNKQEERMKKLSSLSMQLYGSKGHPSIQHVTSKNKDMFDSFTVIRSELNILTENIKLVEKEKIKEIREKEEMDAALHAAQAEAEAAKVAAQQAKAAAKAAEAAVKSVPVPKPVPVIINRPPIFIVPLKDAEVPEGTKVTLECKVEGLPQPQIQWFKDGILAETNPDYQTKFLDGVCTLTIEETFSEDTAKFTCRATNIAGIAETHGNLYIKESRPPDGLIPPHFIKEPKDTTVTEGGLHRFDCQVSGNPLPLISWFKDDVCIDNSTDYSVMYNNGFCTLCLEETNLDHAGRYTCRAVNQAGQIACSASLRVESSTPVERPIFVTPLSNVMARAGQKLRLECAVKGQPEPQVTWLQNSKAIKETRDIKMHFDGHKATLVITEAFPKDAGIYTIVAKNKAGEAVSTCTVSVKGRLPLETSDSEMASDIEPAKPQVKQQLDDQTVTEGNKVRMDCIIVGQPEPEVIWYHNGKPVKESDDFQLLFEGDRCTLIIKVAYLEDAGAYKCVAINSGGEASSQCQLFVQPTQETVQKSHLSQKEIILSVEQPKPPKFIRLLKDASITEGSSVKLECQVVDGPEIKIKWFKDGKEVYTSKELEIKEDSVGTTSLNICSVKKDHQGSFSVSAQNKAGEAKSFCTLTVTPLPIPQKPVWESPPVFIQNIEESRVSVGQPAKFECIVTGVPVPKIKWNFQGYPLFADTDHQLSEDGTKNSLIIRSAIKEYAGRYSVVAENDSGIATSSALLHVEEPLERITSDSLYEQTAQTMIMAKKTTIVEKCTISSMSEVTDSSPIEAIPAKVMLPKAIPSIPELIKTETTTPVPIIPEIVSTPPKFIKPLNANLVTEGEKLYMEANIEGSPEPTIQWFKDGTELQNKPPDTVILCCLGRASLSIPKSKEVNSGKYSCVASNVAGKATSIAEIKVKPYREPPKFIKRLQANVVKSGARVNLDIEVTGVPVPTVQWYRNGALVESSPDFRLTSEGNKHSLFISEAFPDDSGLFMVTARNAAGEAKCLADIIVEDDRSPDEEKIISYQQVSSIEQKKEVIMKVSSAVPTSIEPYEPTHIESYKPVSIEPYKPVSIEPYKPVSIEPYKPVSIEPYKPVSIEPYKPVSIEPYKPVSIEPYKPTAIEPFKPTFIESPKPTLIASYKTTFTEAPKPTPIETPKPTLIEAPKPTPTETPKPTFVEVPKLTPIEIPKPTVIEAPKPLTIDIVKETPKTPSPPPIPAIVAKVWSQTKPETHTPKIEQAPALEDIPILENIEEPVVEFPKVETISTEISPLTTSFTSIQSDQSFVKQAISKFSEKEQLQEHELQPFPPIPIPNLETEVKIETKFVDSKPLQALMTNGIHTDETVSSFKKKSTHISHSFTSASSITEKSIPSPIKFTPKPLDSFKPSPVWAPGQSFKQEISTVSHEPVKVQTRTFPEMPILASADIVEYKDVTVTPVSETKVLADSDTTKFFSSSSSVTSVHKTITHITTEETSETKQYEMESQHKVITTDKKDTLPKPIIKKKDGPSVDGPKPKKAVIIEEEPVVSAEVKPPVFSKVRGEKCMWKIT